MIPSDGPLIAIVGPTASGKTALAIEIATQIGGEIICADSRTIYKGLDIGTAKPTAAERARVPHHLMDVIEPNERLGAAQFKELAERATEGIWSRGHVPLLVGGSGLYVDSVLYDYQFPVEANVGERQRLNEQELPQLVEQLRLRDPTAYNVIDLANKRRVVRAIETAGVGRTKRQLLSENTLVLGIALDKNIARERITQRVENMLGEGFIDEVRRVGQTYGWDSEAMSIIGYRACKAVALGQEPLEVGKQNFIAGDMALYKKQVTWFKRNVDIHWVTNPNDAFQLVSEFLAV